MQILGILHDQMSGGIFIFYIYLAFKPMPLPKYIYTTNVTLSVCHMPQNISF